MYVKIRQYEDELHDFSHIPVNGSFVNNWIQKFTIINLLGQTFQSAEARSQRGSYIQALFLERAGGEQPSTVAWPGQVLYFFTHDLTVNGIPARHTFALVRWYASSVSGQQSFENEGLEIWDDNFLPLDSLSILPVHRIHSQVAIVRYKRPRSTNSKIVVIP